MGWIRVALLAAVVTCLFGACGKSETAPDAASGNAGTPSTLPHAGGGSVGGPAVGGSVAVGGNTGGTGGAAVAGAAAGPAANEDGGALSAAGQAGASNPGGSGGEPGGAECATDHDCALLNDCCTCAVGPSSAQPPACEKVCIQSACAARGIQAKAVCRSKRCVFDLSCDDSKVTCKAAKPQCQAGQVPSVVGMCWGPCIDAGQCRDVADCTDCSAGQVCVKNGDSPLPFTQCVSVTSNCAKNPSCGCADACPFSCNDASGIACFCVTC